jgi:hypothetical protein
VKIKRIFIKTTKASEGHQKIVITKYSKPTQGQSSKHIKPTQGRSLELINKMTNNNIKYKGEEEEIIQ